MASVTSGWEPVRAKNARGDHFTTTRALAELAGDEILEDRAAVDRFGNWLPVKKNVSVKPEAKATKKEGK